MRKGIILVILILLSLTGEYTLTSAKSVLLSSSYLSYSAGFNLGWLNIPPDQLPWNSINILIDFNVVTSPSRDGTISLVNLTPAQMQASVSASHLRGKRALLSIGGSEDLNWDAACSSVNRVKFATNLASLIKFFGYDGVDLDIEQDFGYPDYVDLTACVSIIHDMIKAISPNELITNDTDPTWMWEFASHFALYCDYLMFMNYWNLAKDLPTMVSAYTNFGIPVSKLVTGLGTDPTDPTQVDIGASPDVLNKVQYALANGMAGVMNWYITTPTVGTNTIASYVR